MILPSKHIPESQTVLGVGAVLLQAMGPPQTVTSLWEKVRKHRSVGTFERFVLAVDMLNIFGMVTLDDGMIKRTDR